MRTGGLASARSEPGDVARWGTSASAPGPAGSGATDAAGTDSSASSSSSFSSAEGAVGVAAGSKAPWTCRAAAVFLRGRRVAPRSALLRPTRLSPSPPPLAAGLERSISCSSPEPCPWSGAASPAGAAPSSSPIRMIGVPTSTVSPSSTSRAETGPAYGEGSSTSDLAVSTSTTMSLISTWSPTLTFQLTISASVSPSPGSGRLYSGMRCSSGRPGRGAAQ